MLLLKIYMGLFAVVSAFLAGYSFGWSLDSEKKFAGLVPMGFLLVIPIFVWLIIVL